MPRRCPLPLSLAFCLAGLACTLGLVLVGPQIDQPALRFGLLVAWALSPYIGLAICCGLIRTPPRATWALAAITAIDVIAGVAVLVEARLRQPDDQLTVILIVTPIFQWLGLLAVIVALTTVFRSDEPVA